MSNWKLKRKRARPARLPPSTPIDSKEIAQFLMDNVGFGDTRRAVLTTEFESAPGTYENFGYVIYIDNCFWGKRQRVAAHRHVCKELIDEARKNIAKLRQKEAEDDKTKNNEHEATEKDAAVKDDINLN
jgi:hypothetical protein